MSVSHYVPHVVEIMHGPGYSRTHISHAHCLLATPFLGTFKMAESLRASYGQRMAVDSPYVKNKVPFYQRLFQVRYYGRSMYVK